MRQYKAIIVDDEPSARRVIRYLCDQYAASIDIVAEAGDGTTAIELIEQHKPDLVFLDIQLSDMTGFEALEKLSHKTNIIFTTAYEQFAIKAFETFAVDYLLKPIKDERFITAIKKFEHFEGGKQIDYFELNKLIETLKPKVVSTTFPVKIGEKIIFIDLTDISYFEANDKYVNLFTLNGQKYLTDLTLTALEDKLSGKFLRVKKSFIINTHHIKEVHKHFNSRFVFIMNDKSNSRIVSGSSYADVIKSTLGI